MGTCSLSSKRQEKIQNSQEKLPPFTYLSREHQLLITCHKGKSQAFSFSDSIHLFPDTTISHINPTFIIALGGTDPSGTISKKIFAVNTVNFTLHILPDLPNPLSRPSIFYRNHSLLVLNSEYPQLLSYKLDANDWCEVQLNFSHSKYKKLKGYSAYLQGPYIHLICSTYKSRPKNQIFRISLTNYTLEKSPEVFEPFISNPIIISTDHSILLGGGSKPNGDPNTYFYYKKLSQPWEEFKGPSIKYEDYPFIISKNLPIFFAGPQIVVKFPNRFWVFNLSLPKEVNLNEISNESKAGNSEKTVRLEWSESKPVELNIDSKEGELGKDLNLELSESQPEDLNKEFKDDEQEKDVNFEWGESKPVGLGLNETGGEVDVVEDKFVTEEKVRTRAVVHLGGNRTEEIKVIKVKAVAPFLPSNVKKEYCFESESSFVDSSFDN